MNNLSRRSQKALVGKCRRKSNTGWVHKQTAAGDDRALSHWDLWRQCTTYFRHVLPEQQGSGVVSSPTCHGRSYTWRCQRSHTSGLPCNTGRAHWRNPSRREQWVLTVRCTRTVGSGGMWEGCPQQLLHLLIIMRQKLA